MTYDERTNAIGNLLRDLFRRYEKPSKWEPEDAQDFLRALTEDLNRAWPIMTPDAFAALGEKIGRELRRTYDRRDWPSVKVMLAALSAALKASDAPAFQAPKWDADPRSLAAQRMNKGEPVSEDWVFGERADDLVRSGTVSPERMAAYRRGHEANLVSVYGADKAREMLTRLSGVRV